MLKTGIKGLDTLLKGGFPERSSIVVIGPPGCGKDVLGFQFLYNGLDEGVCFYAYYGQSNEDIENEFSNYGMDLKDAIKKKKIFWIDTSNISKGPNVISSDLKNLITVVLAIKQFVQLHENKQIRGLINVVSHALMLNEPITIYRFATDLVTICKQYNVTAVFLIEEGVHDTKTVKAMESLCDGVIEIRVVEKDMKIEHMFKITKMKGMTSGDRFYKFKIGGKGVEMESK